MLILDRNNEPTSTVYYLAASIYGYLKTYNGIDASSLYQKISQINIAEHTTDCLFCDLSK